MKINKNTISILLLIILFASCKKTNEYHVMSDVPDLQMRDNQLKFKEIKNYKNYKIIATHFRTDKNELRYVLANPKAFRAFTEKTTFPNGSKIVKIGWTVEKMPNFNVALEAKKIQRIEYMIKDTERFSKNPGNWGYARFIKEGKLYKPWQNGTQSCISCHNLAQKTNYVFSKMQNLQE